MASPLNIVVNTAKKMFTRAAAHNSETEESVGFNELPQTRRTRRRLLELDEQQLTTDTDGNRPALSEDDDETANDEASQEELSEGEQIQETEADDVHTDVSATELETEGEATMPPSGRQMRTTPGTREPREQESRPATKQAKSEVISTRATLRDDYMPNRSSRSQARGSGTSPPSRDKRQQSAAYARSAPHRKKRHTDTDSGTPWKESDLASDYYTDGELNNQRQKKATRRLTKRHATRSNPMDYHGLKTRREAGGDHIRASCHYMDREPRDTSDGLSQASETEWESAMSSTEQSSDGRSKHSTNKRGDQRTGRRNKAPTFDGTDWNAFILMFERASRRNRWTESERRDELCASLEGEPKKLLNTAGAENWSSHEVQEALEARYGQNKSVCVVKNELFEIKHKPGQSIYQYADIINTIAQTARMSEVERDAVAHTAFIQGLRDEPDLQRFVEIRTTSGDFGSAIRTAARYVREYGLIEHPLRQMTRLDAILSAPADSTEEVGSLRAERETAGMMVKLGQLSSKLTAKTASDADVAAHADIQTTLLEKIEMLTKKIEAIDFKYEEGERIRKEKNQKSYEERQRRRRNINTNNRGGQQYQGQGDYWQNQGNQQPPNNGNYRPNGYVNNGQYQQGQGPPPTPKPPNPGPENGQSRKD